MANKKIPLHQEIEKIRCELNLSKEQMCDILDLEEGTYDAFIARRRRLTVNQAISFIMSTNRPLNSILPNGLPED